MINKVVIVGNLVRDPDFSKTQSGFHAHALPSPSIDVMVKMKK
jgi:single-stranded DNA-binding protein